MQKRAKPSVGYYTVVLKSGILPASLHFYKSLPYEIELLSYYSKDYSSKPVRF